MRVSSSMIYQSGLQTIQKQTADLLRTQQQVASGRRILSPSDDPIAAARALELGQSKSVNLQFGLNQSNADENLKLLENKLVGIGDVLQYTRERAVQAGNGALSAEDLRYIATDLRTQFEGLVALGNSQNGQGEYLFSGFKAGVQPFVGNLSGVDYLGDQGERNIQVSASRLMPISLPGDDIFDRTRLIDVTSVRDATPEKPTTNEALYSFRGDNNQGSSGGLAVSFVNTNLPPDDPTSARNPDNQGRRYLLTYSEATVGDPATGSYTIEEVVPGIGRSTVAAGVAPGNFAFNGIEITLPTRVPSANASQPDNLVNGDAFEVMVASSNMFKNYGLVVGAMEDHSGVGPAGGVAFALENLDFAVENVLKARAQIGSQMVEIDQLKTLGSDLDLQYSQAISRFEDVDYAEAITRLTQQQTFLQAAQQSFIRVTGLTLFNFLN